MLLREHPVGVLLVEAADYDDPTRLQSLQAIASQAAVAVGTTMMCIDRAQRLAVQDERLRIAQDIHDTSSQTLFGLHYALQACVKLLPDHPGQVKAELENLSQMADTARTQVRQSILNLWPTAITAERFTADLQKFTREHCRAESLDLTIEVRGGFQRLSPGVRRGLYRIAQEAITNVAQHAAASQVSICLDVQPGEALLTVRDNGRGFNPASALARERDREHFGLRGIQDRAAALGGVAEFLSQPGAGTTVMMTLPLNGDRPHV
jgi:signal transduction histidine kinase